MSFKTGGVARHIDARRGGKDALAFEAPPAPTVNAPGPAAPVAPAPVTPDKPPPSTKPLGPVVFFVALGVTAALGAGTIVSGIDAKNNPGVDAVRRACAGKDESCPAYQDGKSAELRTNVLLGFTLGAAALTGVIGVFFTQWSSSAGRVDTTGLTRGVRLGAAPLPGGGSLGAVGTF